MADITFETLVNGSATQSDLVELDNFGINHSRNFDKIAAPSDTEGWYKFDDIVSTLETGHVRWPGGTYAETYAPVVDPNPNVSGDAYLDPNLTTIVDRTGNGATKTVQGLDTFAEGLKQISGSGPEIGITVVIPTAVFGTAYSSGAKQGLVVPDWNVMPTQWSNIDPTSDAYQNFQRVVEDFVYRCLDAVEGNATIEAFEIGNEYESYFHSQAYGKIANQMTQFIDNAVARYNSEQGQDADPKTYVQIWGNTSGGGMSPDLLENRNTGVLDQFSADSLSKIDGVVTHDYYEQGLVNGVGEPSGISESYDTIDDLMQFYRSLADEWDAAAGRELDLVVTEWNVSFKTRVPEADWFDGSGNSVSQEFIDGTTLGLKALGPVMELFSAMMAEGVDAAHIWSPIYNANSVAQGGSQLLTVLGGFFDVLQDKTLGRRFVDLGVEDAAHDAHFFAGADSSTLFVSSIQDTGQVVTLDLGALGVADGSFDLTVLGVHDDQGNFTGDNQFRANGVDYEDVPDWLDINAVLVPRSVTVDVVNGVAQLPLAAYEVAMLDLTATYVDGQLILPPPPPVVDPDAVPEGGEQPTVDLNPSGKRTDGTSGDDIIHGDDQDVDLRGGNGDDILQDGTGKDTLRGEGGRDIFRLVADGHHDTIKDFDLTVFNGEVERVDISALGVASWDQINVMLDGNGTGSHMGFYFDEVKDRLYLHAGDGNRIEFRFDANDLVDASGNLLLGEEHFIFTGTVGGDTGGGDTGGGDTGGGDTGGGDTGGYNVINAVEADSRTDGTKEADKIIGSDGNDDLRGGNGDDMLIDGDGNDMLRGGNDDDIFVFNTAGDKEVLADFNQGNDVIDLTAFNLSGWGDLADGFSDSYDAANRDGSRVYLWFDGDGDGVDDTRLEFRHKDGKHEIFDADGNIQIFADDFLF